jgi:hypothetical protein
VSEIKVLRYAYLLIFLKGRLLDRNRRGITPGL